MLPKIKKILLGYYLWCYLISVHVSGYNKGTTFTPWNTVDFVIALAAAVPLGAMNMILYPIHLISPPEPEPIDLPPL